MEGLVAGLLLWMAVWLVRRARRATTRGVRELAWAFAGACVVSTAAAAQRMGADAVQAGWLPQSVGSFLWGPWQLLPVVMVLAVNAWLASVLVRFLPPLGRAERMVKVLTGRLPHEVDVADADLSPREREVLELIRAGQLADDELAATLFIAPSTAATHVQRLLRKTGLHNRRELMLAADARELRSPETRWRVPASITIRLRHVSTARRKAGPRTETLHRNGEAVQPGTDELPR